MRSVYEIAEQQNANLMLGLFVFVCVSLKFYLSLILSVILLSNFYTRNFTHTGSTSTVTAQEFIKGLADLSDEEFNSIVHDKTAGTATAYALVFVFVAVSVLFSLSLCPCVILRVYRV